MQRRPPLRLRQNRTTAVMAASAARTAAPSARTRERPASPTAPITPVATASEAAAAIADTSSGATAPPASVSVRHEPRKAAGSGLRSDVGAEGEQDAARQAVADPEHRGEHGEPHRRLREVVREGERDEARAHQDHRRQRRPQPPEAVHHLAARVEQCEVDRARDADHERDRLRVESDRHAPQRQHDLTRRADGREGCRGQPERRQHAAVAPHRAHHTGAGVRSVALAVAEPDRRDRRSGIDPVTGSPVSSVSTVARGGRGRRRATASRGRDPGAPAGSSRRGIRRRTRWSRARRRRGRGGRRRRRGR